MASSYASNWSSFGTPHPTAINGGRVRGNIAATLGAYTLLLRCSFDRLL